MKEAGDPVLNYLKDVMFYVQLNHIPHILVFPETFNGYSKDEQRLCLWHCRHKLVGCPASYPNAPEPPDAVKLFIGGGPRPPITG